MDFLHSRQFRSGSYAGVYVLVFVGILAAVNWLGVQYNETFDATSQKLYSLSDQTDKILDNLDRDVTMSYFDRTSEFARAEDMLRRYENASSRVRVEYVDPDEDPVKAEAMNVRSYGTLILHIGGERQEASSTSEQDITNAIITALKGQEKTACVATGHGESASGDMERDGFANAKSLIEDSNYGYEDVSLALDGVPADCTLLMIPGPSTAYFDPEIEAIREFVEGGGRALIMLRPAFPDQRGRRDEPSPNLVALLAEWGIEAGNDIVIDESAIGQLFGGGPFTPLVSGYKYHPIVEPMENVATLFPRARSVGRAEETPDGWTVDELFETSTASFATESMTIEGSAVRIGPASSRTEGPIVLAVAAEHDVPEPEAESPEEEAELGDEPAESDEAADLEGRVVAVGSNGFASNYGLSLGGNQDLLLNMMNWLSSDEDLISIRPRDPDSTPVDMTSAEMWRIFVGSILLLPLVIIVTGVWTWWGRR
jgi:ABC-type uncharacterized transport system involved in gliding motility auxiliary subunit